MGSEGLKAGMSAAVDAIGLPDELDPGEQLDLLGLPAPTPEQARAIELRRGPGRPAGARNKRTLAWADYLLARHANPVEVLLQIAESRVDELVAALGCSKLEALQEKRHAAVAAAPYVMQRQATAIDLTGAPAIHLTINRGESRPASVGLGSLAGRILEVLDNQDVSDDEETELQQNGEASDA